MKDTNSKENVKAHVQNFNNLVEVSGDQIMSVAILANVIATNHGEHFDDKQVATLNEFYKSTKNLYRMTLEMKEEDNERN